MVKTLYSLLFALFVLAGIWKIIPSKKKLSSETIPPSEQTREADVLIFSFDRPLQLYACLESIERYMTPLKNVSVLYRTSTSNFSSGYKELEKRFPFAQFIAQSTDDPKHDFKPNVLKVLFSSPSKYILFGVDDIIVKDFVDLEFCIDQMEETGAYGFYLRFGNHIDHCYQSNRPQSIPQSEPVKAGVFAWDIQKGESDWGFPNSLDMTLYRKEDLKRPFYEMKYKTPNSLESNWAKGYPPHPPVGLYFEHSKIVNIPMNLVGRTGNPHMNYLNSEELLVKFNEGLKIDIEPLHQIKNRSPHIDYIPELVPRERP